MSLRIWRLWKEDCISMINLMHPCPWTCWKGQCLASPLHLWQRLLIDSRMRRVIKRIAFKQVDINAPPPIDMHPPSQAYSVNWPPQSFLTPTPLTPIAIIKRAGSTPFHSTSVAKLCFSWSFFWQHSSSTNRGKEHYVLNITLPNATDAGEYFCRVTFHLGPMSTSLNKSAGFLNLYRKLPSKNYCFKTQCLRSHVWRSRVENEH